MNFQEKGINICKITTKKPDKTFEDINIYKPKNGR